MRIIDQLSFSDKLRIVEEYRSNEGSLHELARKYGISHTSIWRWNRIFAPVKRSSRMNTNKDLKSQEMRSASVNWEQNLSVCVFWWKPKTSCWTSLRNRPALMREKKLVPNSRTLARATSFPAYGFDKSSTRLLK